MYFVTPARPSPRTPSTLFALGALAALVSGCASGAGAGRDVATDAEWRALAGARPTPLDGAARVTVSEVLLTAPYAWRAPGTVSAELGIAELVVAGLLRRRDVNFVERRRFSAAAEAERAGDRRRPGQPPAGVSQSVDFSVTAVWIPTGGDQASLEVRLTVLETGDIEGATRVPVASDADPVTLGRAVVTGVLEVLQEVGRLPNWIDPQTASTNADPASRVSDGAQRSFFQALASEERWDWEGARRGYQQATNDPAFWEASVVLARAARLRLGGTLAES